MLYFLRTFIIFFSIPALLAFVEWFFQMRRRCQLFQQNSLRPFLLPSLFQIPPACISRQFRFHDHHVQRPADFHRQMEERLVIFISPIKIAHPAHVARRKACAVREIHLQKLRGSDRCAFLLALTDCLANGIHFVHLRKILCENCGQFSVHRAVIHRFSNVHGFSFPRWCASYISSFCE